jgi:hypothetical protein
MREFSIYDLRFTIADSSRWLSAIGDWLSRRSGRDYSKGVVTPAARGRLLLLIFFLLLNPCDWRLRKRLRLRTQPSARHCQSRPYSNPWFDTVGEGNILRPCKSSSRRNWIGSWKKKSLRASTRIRAKWSVKLCASCLSENRCWIGCGKKPGAASRSWMQARRLTSTAKNFWPKCKNAIRAEPNGFVSRNSRSAIWIPSTLTPSRNGGANKPTVTSTTSGTPSRTSPKPRNAGGCATSCIPAAAYASRAGTRLSTASTNVVWRSPASFTTPWISRATFHAISWAGVDVLTRSNRANVLEFGRGLPHSKTLRETGGAA